MKEPAFFLVVALITAPFGFGWMAGSGAEIAKALFFIFLILFLVSLFDRRSTA